MARKYQLHGAFPSKAGDSAYEVALKNGFEGTEQEWLTSLNGKDGADAPQEAILYTPQSLTTEQQAQARANIGAVAAPETAEVGQTIVVKEVDENGKPTAWEAANLPTEDEWELIASGTMEEDARGITLTLDNEGNPFELKKAALHLTNISRGAEMASDVTCYVTIGDAAWKNILSARDISQTFSKETIAYSDMNGSAWMAVRETHANNRGPMNRPFSDFVGKTITSAYFNAANAQHKLSAGLTYELWGVRK